MSWTEEVIVQCLSCQLVVLCWG